MNPFNGLKLLVESPSGVFSLLCLTILTGLSLHNAASMTGAWIAFFGVVPAMLTIAEHRETMAQIKETHTSSS